MSSNRITLTPAQREIARISMPHLSPVEAEKAYARGLARLAEEKRNGNYQDRG
jgi:hypothetical protein